MEPGTHEYIECYVTVELQQVSTNIIQSFLRS